jgi:hypothetical protein
LPDSIKTDLIDVDLNAEPSTNSTFLGITIDSSFDDENAYDSIRFNDDGDSNEIDESDLQYEKHSDPRISTEHGITIDSSFDDENAFHSIRFNDDGDSNEIESNEDRSETTCPSNRPHELATQIRPSEITPQGIPLTRRTPSITITRRTAPNIPKTHSRAINFSKSLKKQS